MNLLRFYRYLPEHLKDDIFLNLDPRYFVLWDFFVPNPKQVELYNKKWISDKKLSREGFLIKLSELGYYGLFDTLFNQYRGIELSDKGVNTLLKFASKNGWIEYINKLLSWGGNNYHNKNKYNDAMIYAAFGGHIEIVESMLDLMNSKGINPNYNEAMRIAAFGGNLKIVQLMLKLGAHNYNETMETAARSGSHAAALEIVKLMLDLGANNYNDTIESAAYSGYFEIFKLMLDLMITDGIEPNYKKIMALAAKGGQPGALKIVQLMLKLGANNYNETMASAVRVVSLDKVASAPDAAHPEIVQLMLDLGANNYNETMALAAGAGQLEIVKLMLDLGANNYNETMASAAEAGQLEIVQLMLDLGANDYNKAMELASFGGQLEIVELMLDLMNEKGITPNYKRAIDYANSFGHIDILKLLLKIAPRYNPMSDSGVDYSREMIQAIMYSHPNLEEIVKLMLKYGADRYYEGMIFAIVHGHPEIVKLLLESGASQYKEAIKLAKEKNRPDILNIIRTYMIDNNIN